jgi:hypothetical protein
MLCAYVWEFTYNRHEYKYMMKQVVMGGTQNSVYGKYREKVPPYRVYRGFVVLFAIVETKVKHAIITV